jgi:ribosomal subunit interface protein
MQIPLQVTFRHIEPSESVEARIRERLDRLGRYKDRITACRVAIEGVRKQSVPKLFKVRVEVSYPGGEITVAREQHESQSQQGLYIAVNEAFEAARRQLADKAEKLAGIVKTHEVPPHGVVDRIFTDEGYGFVRMPDGQEIYFHRNAVVDDGFDALETGTKVRCEVAEGEGIKGAQASTVRPINHNLPPVERVRV